MRFDFPALGTHWWIEVWDEVQGETEGKIKDFSLRFVSDFEARYSRFLPESELSILNRDRTLPHPSAETRELFGYSLQLFRHTRGVFNSLLGHILEARGYDGAYSFIDKGSAALEPGNPLTDLLISDTEIKLLYGNLDIGGYGKGWLIDKLAFALADRFGVQQFLINGGGDLYVTHQNNQPVEIYLENPMRPGTLVGSTKLMNRGFACSSPHKRSWTNTAGIDQNHIVTNTTMRDATYVTAPTAVAADAFATTFLLTSRAETARLVADHQLEIL